MITLPLPWQQAIDRVREHGRNPLYMPSALLAAVSYVEDKSKEGETADLRIPFAEFEKRFRAEMQHLDAAKKSNPYLPFCRLSNRANVWDLFYGAGPTQFILKQ